MKTFSGADRSRTPKLVSLIRSYSSKWVSITLSILSPSIEWIIKPLPCLPRVSIIVSLCVMEIRNIFKLRFYQVKIETNLSLNLCTIQKHEKLWFISSIEIEFDFWCGIAVDLDVCPCGCFVAEVLIILIYIFTCWIPVCVEIQTGEYWSLIV